MAGGDGRSLAEETLTALGASCLEHRVIQGAPRHRSRGDGGASAAGHGFRAAAGGHEPERAVYGPCGVSPTGFCDLSRLRRLALVANA